MSPRKNQQPGPPKPDQQPPLVDNAIAGDDAELAAMMAAEGDAEPSAAVETNAPGRDVAGTPSTVDLEDLLAHFHIDPAHVLAWRGAREEGLVVVTVGGEKIEWPQDMTREIPRSRLTGENGARGRVFPGGYLRRDASKDPRD